MICTEPLPNVRLPSTLARLWSCSAPATISEAEADPTLTSTTMGTVLAHAGRPARQLPSPRAYSAGVARYLWRDSGGRPSVDTPSTAGGREAAATPLALVRRPPGPVPRSG